MTSNYSLPTVNEAVAGAEVTSACMTFGGIPAGQTVQLNTLRGSYSVNEGAYVPAATRTQVNNGDRLRLKMNASTTPNEERLENIELQFGSNPVSIRQWTVRTQTGTRAPVTWQVGASRTYKEIADVAGQLSPGDVVELDAGVYQPARLRRAGAEAAPIVIRGVGASRPVIRGTSTDAYQATLHFDNVHHYLLENVEVDGGGGTRATSNNQVCVRLMGNVLVLRNVYVHGCPRHGILGTDEYSGTVILDRVEVANAGGPNNGVENTKHPIYIATDRDRYPGSLLRVQHSYIHDYEGGGVKSRSERNEIYFNWVETRPQRARLPGETQDATLYTLEMYGYEEFESTPRIDSDVVGNVLVHRNNYGLRLGGDGTGASRGRVRLANNTILFSSAFDASTPLVRLFHSLDSLWFLNNVFARVGAGQSAFRMFRDDIAAENDPDYYWVQGVPLVSGQSNWFATGTELRLYSGSPSTTPPSPAASFSGSRQGTANPGLTALGSFDAVDVTVVNASELHGNGASASAALPAAYELPSSLQVINFRAPATRPATGAALTAIPRPAGALNIGAF